MVQQAQLPSTRWKFEILVLELQSENNVVTQDQTIYPYDNACI